MRTHRILVGIAAAVAVAAAGLPRAADLPAEAQSGSDAPPPYTLPAWSDMAGWSQAGSYSTIQTADVTGDGRAELLGRSPHGMQTWHFDTDLGHWLPSAYQNLWSDEQGWDAPEYYGTIQTADVTGDGRHELLARDADGMVTYQLQSNHWQLIATGPEWSDTNGWDHPEYYETIQTADVTGDGRHELLARDADGMVTYQLQNNHWQLIATGPEWSDTNGWDHPGFYETIQTADLTGDGRAELFARDHSGIVIYRLNGSDWQFVEEGPGLSEAAGWDHPEYYRTIQAIDLVEGGGAELTARDSEGLRVWRREAGTWTVFGQGISMPDAAGWDLPNAYLTIQPAKVRPGDTYQLAARGPDGLQVWAMDSNGNWEVLGSQQMLTNAEGWNHDDRALTITFADLDGSGTQSLLARDRPGVRTWLASGSGSDFAWNPAGVAEFPAFTPAQQRAYSYVNSELGSGSPDFDLRSAYGDGSAALNRYTEELQNLPSPNAKNIPRKQWNALRTELLDELNWAGVANDWHDQVDYVLTHSTIADGLTIAAIASALEVNHHATLHAAVGSLLVGTVTAMAGAAGAGPAAPFLGALFGAAFNMTGGPDPASVWEGTYTTLANDLDGVYSQASAHNSEVLSAIVGDYGLLRANATAGANLLSPDQLDHAVSAAVRRWTVFAYQTMAPSVWGYMICGPHLGSSESCERTGPPYDGRFAYHDGDERRWLVEADLDAFANAYPDVSESLNEYLFTQPSAGCASAFTHSCPLGLDLETVLFDWDLQRRINPTPPPPQEP